MSPINPLVLAPSTIPNSAPLAYIEAGARAGYQWIGLRLNASPGLPYHPVVGDAALIRAMKQAIAAAGLTVLDIYSFYLDRKSTRLNSSHLARSRMPSSA